MHKNCEWIAIGCKFGPVCSFTACDGTGKIMVQYLIALCVTTGKAVPIAPDPWEVGPFTAAHLIDFLEKVFRVHGKPGIGVVFSATIWRSSIDLALSDETAAAGNFMLDLQDPIPQMSPSERSLLQSWLEDRHLLVQWS